MEKLITYIGVSVFWILILLGSIVILLGVCWLTEKILRKITIHFKVYREFVAWIRNRKDFREWIKREHDIDLNELNKNS